MRHTWRQSRRRVAGEEACARCKQDKNRRAGDAGHGCYHWGYSQQTQIAGVGERKKCRHKNGGPELSRQEFSDYFEHFMMINHAEVVNSGHFDVAMSDNFR